MDDVTLQNLQDLASEEARTCVSLYMTTHPVGTEGEQDALRWKKLLQDAEHSLMDRNFHAGEAKSFLAPAYDLPHDTAVWQNRSQGLAAFVSSQTWCYFRVQRPFDDVAIVNRRFQIKRLLPLLIDGLPFYILTLSQNHVRLYKASHHQIEQVDVTGLPASMDEVLNYTAVDRGSQVHSAMKGRLGKQAAVFHGQGGQADTHKDDLKEFFRFIDDAIQPVLLKNPAPLLLAGVESHFPIYRSVNGYSHVLDQQLAGNFDYHTPTQLLEQAWPLLETALHQDQNAVVLRYTNLIGTDRTTNDIERILIAAHEGRIDVLFVNPDAVRWGRFNPADRIAITYSNHRPGAEDLLEEAIAETLGRKGTVYPIDPGQLPRDTNIAALLRY